MKSLLAPVFGALLLMSRPVAAAPLDAAPPAGDAAELAEAQAIIQLMFPPEERQRTFDKLMTQLAAQFRSALPGGAFSDPGLKAIMDDYLDRSLELQKPLLRKHLPELFDATAVGYTHEFSLAELKDIHAFALTPSGRHYLSRSAAIVGDPAVAKVNSAMIAEAQALSMSLIAEMKDKLVAYLKAHPDVAEKLAAERAQ